MATAEVVARTVAEIAGRRFPSIATIYCQHALPSFKLAGLITCT